MNTDVINKEFAKMIAKRGVYSKLGITAGYVQQLRYKLANGINVSTDTKLALLQKSGWRQDDRVYNQNGLVAAVKFALRQGAAARAQGAEYLVEKFLSKRPHP